MSLIELKDVYKIYNEGQENQVNALDGVTPVSYTHLAVGLGWAAVRVR